MRSIWSSDPKASVGKTSLAVSGVNSCNWQLALKMDIF